MRPFLPFQGDITMKHDAAITALRNAHAALSSIAAVTCYTDD